LNRAAVVPLQCGHDFVRIVVAPAAEQDVTNYDVPVILIAVPAIVARVPRWGARDAVVEGLSWVMLALFGAGTGLWFLYGLLRMSGPLMLANGLTGLQILFLIALKLRFAITSCSEGPQPEATAYTPNKFPPAVLDTWGIGNLSQRVGRGRRSSRDPSEQLWRSNT
jgi:hypothetical protein